MLEAANNAGRENCELTSSVDGLQFIRCTFAPRRSPILASIALLAVNKWRFLSLKFKSLLTSEEETFFSPENNESMVIFDSSFVVSFFSSIPLHYRPTRPRVSAATAAPLEKRFNCLNCVAELLQRRTNVHSAQQTEETKLFCETP